MKKSTLKYFTTAFVLAFLSASLYCSVEAFAQAAIEFAVSHHHDDDDGAESHDHSAGGHHHGNDATPNADNDFCCSQLNGILSKWDNSASAAKSLSFVVNVHIVEQNSNLTPFNAPEWLLHDKAPPSGLRSTLFYDLNFSSHAPPSSLSC